MSAVYDYMTKLRDDIGTIADITSSSIGIETGIGSKDSPFARIVPIEVTPIDGISGEPKLRFQVAFGFSTQNRDYDKLHEQYFDMSKKIIEKANALNAEWIRTVTDEDTVRNLKTAIVEFEVELDSCQ